ncbi:DUF4468 domain-containing protein [Dyadobacter sp. CY326]|uniref:DUF4468 domain-containing protein n=1 Tax=Dyadobacter sp. CY326 TaxID=2907300 RepID=UPI001F225D97|nr:DUF4468 domain-containing protein [Dyadobacter sp. CY326]MCE7066946.1 DUF4468 domain-containing protein [Dyadobacter sp. CY326]
MKQFLPSTILSIFLLFAQQSHAQKAGLPYNRFTGEITQTKFVQTGQSREKSYNAIKAWIVKKYPNHRQLIRIDDAGSGQLVLQDTEPISSAKFKSFSYRVNIDIKDGNYTCTINTVKTLSPGADSYVTADQDFSNMGMYGQDIDDIDREISITKDKKELAKLFNERRVLTSFLRDYHKSHYVMDLHFTMIQNGIYQSVAGAGSLAAK